MPMRDAVAALSDHGRAPLRWIIGGAMLAEATTFLIASMLHRGVQIPLGFALLAEPSIRPAATVETICAVGLVTGATALLTAQRWGWQAAMGAHLLASGGVLLGMAALAAGRGPRTASNDAYHLIILAALIAGAAVLATPSARAVLRRPS
jgi:hypothetical protein